MTNVSGQIKDTQKWVSPIFCTQTNAKSMTERLYFDFKSKDSIIFPFKISLQNCRSVYLRTKTIQIPSAHLGPCCAGSLTLNFRWEQSAIDGKGFQKHSEGSSFCCDLCQERLTVLLNNQNLANANRCKEEFNWRCFGDKMLISTNTNDISRAL